MARTKFDKARVNDIVTRLIGGTAAVSRDDVAYLRRYMNQDADFRNWFQSEYGHRISLNPGEVRIAKDAYDTYGFTPTPNRGKVGQDTASMVMRSGMRTNQREGIGDVKIQSVRNRSAGRQPLYTATPDGGRKRTSAELAAIVRRGSSGATMNLEDQRIYDRWVTQQREARENAMKDAANRELAKRNAAERASKFQLLGMEDDGTLNDLQIAELMAKREARNKTDEELYKQSVLKRMEASASAEEARRTDEAKRLAAEVKRRQSETDNGRTTDMTDDDYAEWMNKGGSKFARWGYSDEDQKTIDALRNDIRTKWNNGTFNGFEAAEANRQLDEQIANGRWKKRVSARSDVPSGEPTISADGKFYASDGKWIPLTDRETPEEREKRTNRERRDKWIDSRAEKYMKETQGQFDENPGSPLYTYEQALEMAKRDADVRYPDKRDYGRYPFLGDENFKDDAKACPICGAPLDASGYCAECGYQEGAEQGGYDATDTGVDTDTQDEATEQPMQAGTHMKSSYL